MAGKARGDLLLVGLDNPQSNDPRHALFPYPPGCSGYRLMQFIQLADPNFTRMQYVSVHKTNLFPVGMAPKRGAGRARKLADAAVLLHGQLSGTGRKVVLLGDEVARAVLGDLIELGGLKECTFERIDGVHYAWIPHPSGRNHYYNDEGARLKIGQFLRRNIRVET